MKVAYVRVSTAEQNEDRQIESLKKYNIEKWYTEKISGKNTNRPKLREMLDFVREGDTIYIHDFSRLARSTKDLLDIIEKLGQKNVALISIKESLDTSTATGKLMVTVIAAINEFERSNLLERQREGISIAKKKGVYKGRKPITVSDKEFTDAYEEYSSRKITKAVLAQKLGVSRPTLNRLMADFGGVGTDTISE